MLRTAIVLAFLVPYAVVACPLAVLLSIVGRSAAPLYRFSEWGFRGAFLLAGIRITTEGRERLGDVRNTVIVSNHASHLDPPALFLGLRTDFVALAKREVFDIPLFSTVIRRAGYIPIERGNRADAAGAVARMTTALREGACVLVFAEGTRSRDGSLGPFKRGAFVAALDAGSRVVPVAIDGTGSLMPRHGYAVRPGRVHVAVLEPVEAHRYAPEDRDLLIAEVRNRIAQSLSAAAEARGDEYRVA